MDFYYIKERSTKSGVIEVYPDFKVGRSKDLMIRGNAFYAIWDEERHLWSTDEYDVQRLVDQDLHEYAEKLKQKTPGHISVMYMGSFSSRSWTTFQNFITNLSDNSHQLDTKLTFSNTDVKRKDYASKRLSYPLEEGPIDSYDEIMSILYLPEERRKLEWATGAIIAGDAKNIQKFIVLYGAQGSGKSTFLNIVQKMFAGYYTAFEAKTLTSNNNAFATEIFKSDPLVAIQHDGDLSRIEDNSRMNSIVSHEEMTMNVKYKASYTSRINTFLFMGTNKPVKITDAKSGIIRRLIDVTPSGITLPVRKYDALISQIDFELGAIAHHCLEVYRELGKSYYNDYRPMDMILQTDVFYNFVEEHITPFTEMNGVSLSQAYDMYKAYCEMALVEYKLTRHKFREELKNYFATFHAITRVDGRQVRSYYEDFLTEKFEYSKEVPVKEKPLSLVLDSDVSLMNDIMADYPAQYANANGTPKQSWDKVKTTVKDLDTSKLHYVNGPVNHIVIDFDLKDETGNKSAELNLAAASKFPHTYSEFSQGGAGVHLHYWYDGDTDRLSSLYDTDIEVKVYRGDASIRRRLSKCNNVPMATLNSGLPLKGVKMINQETVQSEKSIRNLIKRNLRKEIHPGTKPSIDFIYKILEDAYNSGLAYDVSNLKTRVMSFANNSTNQAHYCLSQVIKMKFTSEVEAPIVEAEDDKPNVFYDIEVFPNLLMIGWKYPGDDAEVNVMINPSPEEVGEFLKMKLVGFNNRRYDNHIIYARYLGYTNEQMYNLSKAIIDKKGNPFFREGYTLAYADVYEFSSIKMSLKKWMIELGIFHKELDLPWDQPVPEEMWDIVADYMKNDVVATEVVFNDRASDLVARQILAELSGLTVAHTTRQHATRIFFGNDKNPQASFIYTDLSTLFPGYKYEMGVSTYRGQIASEGGYVYSEPGVHYDVALLDIESLHPTSAVIMQIFGKYTEQLNSLLKARLGIKHKNFDGVADLFNGRLRKYLQDPEQADALSYALKIVINSIYGFTAAKFDNAFRDPRNIDNIVAKRGALFMIDLLYAVQEKGYTVAHIKTDSIKIAQADDYIIEFVKEFGAGYGYNFQHEATYAQMCLVNDAVYIAKVKWSEKEKEIGTWTATGAQFAHPYVFKTLFSQEPILFEDMCEARSVKSTMYLDYNESGEENMKFVGKTGLFTPIQPGAGGAELVRVQDDKRYAVTGTKGFRWMESVDVRMLEKQQFIDLDYFRALVDGARANISNFGNVDEFINWNWVNECAVDSDYHKKQPTTKPTKLITSEKGEIRI